MPRTVRAAAVQLTPVLENGTGTQEKVLAAIADAARQDVRIAVFPETFVPYYPYFSFVRAPALIGAEHMRLYENAPTVPGPFTEAVAGAARAGGIVVVLGVNERDHGSLYNTQLVFDADGTLLLKRRKITPTFHERMIWGQGDGAGLRVVDSAVGRVGALACWEHYNPLARYALMTQHEEIHCAQFPGSMVGPIFAEQMDVTIRHHALEAGCFVINATGWLTDEQRHAITPEPAMHKALCGGTCSAIISPEGSHLAAPLHEGEGMVVADLDLSLIIKRKRMMDAVGHYARPELLSLRHDRSEARTTTSPEERRSDQDALASLAVPSLAVPLAAPSLPPRRTPDPFLLTELQSLGMRLIDENAGAASRRGGAGPSDHKAVRIDGHTAMVPIHTAPARTSPFSASAPDANGVTTLLRDGVAIGRIAFPPQPRFYALQTPDGVPYWKIAMLHGADVLATTVLQTCIRYGDQRTACQFCAIGHSLESGRTIAHKTPAQLAEVARAAVLLDGVRHMVLTTGTPNLIDRGAAVLCDSARAIRQAVDLPLQAQCEPPRDPVWFERLRDAGIDSLGMHLEAATQPVRARIMPGKATVSVARYLDAFRQAVPVFGRGQVSTYLLAGLGDTAEEILALCDILVGIGVHPFVVPFVPITGTRLQDHAPPSPAFMRAVLAPLSRMLAQAGLASSRVKAGCSRCGACSSLAAYEAA